MLTIRFAEPSDADAAIDVLRRSITELCIADHQGDRDMLSQWLANKTPQHFRAWLADRDHVCLIAEESGALVGVGLIHRDGELRLCYVAPGAQRRGVGKAICLALEGEARKAGLRELRLQSTVSARAFYEHMGYRAGGAAAAGFGASRCHPYRKAIEPAATKGVR
jgi:GNAT superfamily N-acetyltransferase